MRLKRSIRFCFMVAVTVLQAQKNEFGKVDIAEIQQKLHSKDSTASAAIIYKIGKTDMKYDNQWIYNHDVAVRIKVYKKEGYDYATVQVPLYTGSGSGSKEKFLGLKAFTYNVEGGKVVKEKLKSEGEFEEVLNENWVLKKFTFPNVKEGSILEYSYTIVSQFITTLPEWQFEYKIPVDYVEYSTHIPEYFSYKEFNKGYFPLKRDRTTTRGQFTFRYEHQSLGSSAIDAHKSQYQTLDCNIIVNKYIATNIPKITEEAYINNINNYITTLKHELAWSKMPESVVKYHNQTWENVAKKVYDYDGFGKELNRSGYFEADLKSLLDAATTPLEKSAIVFGFVKQKITWNGKYGIGCDKGVREAYKNNTGNIAEINLMLTAMLRYAGVNANPVLVSTRAHGIPLFPTLDGFNYVISAVELNNGLVLLDASSKFSEPNILPERALNWFGRLLRKDGSSAEVSLIPRSVSKEFVTINFDLKEDGELTGKFRKQYTEHAALLFRQNLNAADEQKYQEQLENTFGGIAIESYGVENKFDLGKPIIESFSFAKENSVDVIGDKIYFNPLFFLAHQENPFVLEERQYPVDFSFPKAAKITVNIKLPEGYKIESLPQGVAMKLPDNLGGFKYVISDSGNSVQLMVNSDINEAIINNQYYNHLREYYKQMVAKETEKIVLMKI